MRRTRLSRFISISIFALAAARSCQLRAAGYQTTLPTNRLRVASEEDLAFTLDHYVGKRLQSANEQELGTVDDFLLDPGTGRTRYAVISTGGFLGIGGDLHLVPFSLLTPTYDGQFTARIERSELDLAPVLDKQPFDQDRVVVDAPTQRQIGAAFKATASDSDRVRRAPGALARVSKLEGRDADSDGNKVGHISDIVILPGATHAMAVLQPEESIGQGDRYLVPLRYLRVKPGTDGALATSLSPADLKGAARVSAAIPRPATAGNGLAPVAGPTPTGRTSAAQMPIATPAAIEAARAIRHALDQDETLRRVQVVVTPWRNRVVVHGKVPSDDAKAAVVHTADRAADAATIDFNLAVESK